MHCCQDADCKLLRQLDELSSCAEILRMPPGEAPHCTENCHHLVSKIVSAKYGQDLLSCSCSRVQQQMVPKIGSLCGPFQLNALTKCNVTPSEPVTARPVTARPTTARPVTTAVSSGDLITEEATNNTGIPKSVVCLIGTILCVHQNLSKQMRSHQVQQPQQTSPQLVLH
jgi:hypothetical protein